MIKRLSVKLIGLATVALLCKPVIGQEASFLTQKLMLENDVRKKITEALSKIIDEQKYVIDVSIDLELSSEVQEQITVAPGTEPATGNQLRDLTQAVEQSAEELGTDSRSSHYLPIPGFEFEMSSSPEPAAEISESPTKTTPPASTNGDKILSRVLTDKRPSIARIRKMDISLILQEGAAPELIENIRQIVMVASRFNRARGDALSIMTATFKERRDQRSAEAILLRSISDKVDAMEQQREVEAVTAEKDWRAELEDYKQEEAQRRDQDRTYFQSELDKIEIAARTRAFQQEQNNLLQQDSLKRTMLDERIRRLETAQTVATQADPESQAQLQLAQTELTELDARIAEKNAALLSVQNELDRVKGGANNLPLYLMGLVTLLAVIALVIVLVMGNRSKPRYAPPPPWMMQAPRPRKKKRVPKKTVEEPKAVPAPAPVQVPPATQPPPPVTDDPSVVHSEINDMRKAVVSMSVGQPETATRIVREWMQEEAPPAPEEAEEAEEEAEEAEEPKGKKKKK